MAFKHISLLWNAKGVIMGHVGDTAYFCRGKKKKKKKISPDHVGDTAFLPGQKKKKHITMFGARGSLAFDSAYDINGQNCQKVKMHDI